MLSCGVATLMAAEYHGIVKSAGLPIPGATVVAVNGDQKFTTTTDDQGAFSFSELNQGPWTITVEMFGFAKTSRTIDGAQAGAVQDWDLKLNPPGDLARTPDSVARANTPGAPPQPPNTA
ncbi:MAG TPA: carboxypeptidase-like regulatory domain-containing protein, partial [Bryobacteraceae bacterium]